MREASDGTTANYYVINKELNSLIKICRHMSEVRNIPQDVVLVFRRLYLYGEHDEFIVFDLPEKHEQLQDLISFKNMNAQIGESFRSIYRYGQSSHSDQLRDLKKVHFYLTAESERLENLANQIIDILNRGGVRQSAYIRECKGDVAYMLDLLSGVINEFESK